MPTTRPRHVITETEGVARALDDAAERWPADADRRSKLALRLLEEGHRSLLSRSEITAEARRDAVRATSGSLTGLYGENYLSQLREEWPA